MSRTGHWQRYPSRFKMILRVRCQSGLNRSRRRELDQTTGTPSKKKKETGRSDNAIRSHKQQTHATAGPQVLRAGLEPAHDRRNQSITAPRDRSKESRRISQGNHKQGNNKPSETPTPPESPTGIEPAPRAWRRTKQKDHTRGKPNHQTSGTSGRLRNRTQRPACTASSSHRP